MFIVLGNTWALMLGMMLLMVGNGLQGTLIGVRGELEGFTTIELSVVMSAYFVGFLGASRLVPELIRRVGHVRVFAALASFISAVLIAYPLLANPIFWSLGRVVIGFCYCGVYITAESWLNNSVNNDNRGQALSLYMIVQMIGIVAAQGVLALGDPKGYSLFIIISIIGRGLRFYLIAILLYFFGEKIKLIIDKYFNILTIVFFILLVGSVFIIRFL